MSLADLASKKCTPCRGGVPPFTEAQAREYLSGTPDWSLEENATRLHRRFEFEDFVKAIEFVNRVAEIAEAQGHHPDIAIHYNRVTLRWWTHTEGGVTDRDRELAERSSTLA